MLAMQSKKFSLNVGFTLIELMVTVAIVITLTIVAIPILNRYIAQSKVSDAIGAAQMLKELINNNIASNESVTNSGTGLALPSRLGRYVASFNVSANGVISITTTSTANSVTLILTPAYDASTEQISWSCAVSTSTKNDYVPSECRI